MTTLTPTEQLVFDLERVHAAERQELEEKLKRSTSLVSEISEAERELCKTIEFQQELIRLQEAVMAQQDKQIQRIKPTLFGAFMGGMGSGAILTTVITAYILWVQG